MRPPAFLKNITRQCIRVKPSLAIYLYILLIIGSWSLAASLFAEPIDKGVVIPVDNNVSLNGILTLPEEGASGSPYPAIVFIAPWAAPGEIYRKPAKALAESGYIVLSLAPRGLLGSGGTINSANEQDRADIRKAIDWLIANTKSDPERIGITGVSLGGALSLLVAAEDGRIKAVAAMSPWTDIGKSLYHDYNTGLNAWPSFLMWLAKNYGRLDDSLKFLHERMRAYQLPRDEITAWSYNRSPINYIDKLNQRKVPILMQHGIEDSLFWLRDTLEFYNRLDTPKKLYVNEGEHSSADFTDALGLGPSNGVWSRVKEWFDVYVKKDSAAAITGKPVRFPIRSAQQEFLVDAWQRQTQIQQTYHLTLAHPGQFGQITAAKTESPSTSQVTLESGKEQNAGVNAAIIGPMLRAHFNNPTYVKKITDFSPAKVALFSFGPFAEDRYFLGIPTLKFWIKPQSPKAQLVAYLYEWDGSENLKPISHGPVTLTNAQAGSQLSVNIEMMFTSYRLAAGQKLILALGTSDTYYVSPTAETFKVDLLMDKDQHDATLILPMLPH
jgi:predicted acyl esterase